MYCTQEIKDNIDKLQELFPLAFPKKPLPKVPLAIGTAKAIQAVLDVKYLMADAILYFWCQGKRYHDACTEGAPRYLLDGSTRGIVTQKQLKFALRKHKV